LGLWWLALRELVFGEFLGSNLKTNVISSERIAAINQTQKGGRYLEYFADIPIPFVNLIKIYRFNLPSKIFQFFSSGSLSFGCRPNTFVETGVFHHFVPSSE
jgi:hypothetical protein